MQRDFGFFSVELGDWKGILWEGLNWTVGSTHSWGIYGASGSGKTLLAQALMGHLPLRSGEFRIPNDRFLVSFEAQEAVLRDQERINNTDFQEALDLGTTLRSFLNLGSHISKETEELLREWGLWGLLDQGILGFSTGELRKSLLVQAQLLKPRWILLDEVWEGLDSHSKDLVDKWIQRLLSDSTVQVFLFTSHREKIPLEITQVLCLERLKIKGIFKPKDLPDDRIRPIKKLHCSGELYAFNNPQELVSLEGASVHYGDRMIFDQVNWQIFEGDHTLVRGPNGCGKTTLLHLITGDHPQVYANRVRIFGRYRGSGESIWDIKAHLGILSHRLHIQQSHLGDEGLLEIVVSGAYDTLGLYREPSWSDVKQAKEWLDFFCLTEVRHRSFSQVSFGQQRLALLARSLMKNPRLLILDEPGQGLDEEGLELLLTGTHKVLQLFPVTLILVTHNPQEVPVFCKKILEFRPLESGSYFPVEMRL